MKEFMKTKFIASLLALSGPWLATGAQAADTDKLKAATCLNCHDVEKKKLGPPLKEAASKGFKADELVARMKEGKAGPGGHPKVNKPDGELKAAAEQALAIK